MNWVKTVDKFLPLMRAQKCKTVAQYIQNESFAKINLGCGKDVRENFINLDFRELPGVDIVCDLENDFIPFENGFFDFVFAQDLLEHFPLEKTYRILNEWNRILKTGGALELMVPNTLMNIRQWLDGETKTVREDQSQTHRFSEIMFGGQDYEGNFHKQLFDHERLEQVLNEAGFDVMYMWDRGRGICALGVKR